MKGRTFKNELLRTTYDRCRRNPPERRLGTIADNYWRGFNGEPCLCATNTQAYAAWAAGKDDSRNLTAPDGEGET